MSDIKTVLEKGLKGSNRQLAKLIGDRMTRIQEYPTSFLARGSIHQVEHMEVHHPVMFFVAVGADESVRVLTDDPDGFVAFCREQGVRLADSDDAASYVTALLETTRSTQKLVYLLDSVDSIKFRPSADDREDARRNEFVTTYRPVIRPPAAEPASDGWDVEVYVVVDQKVQRDLVHVSPDGGFTARFEVLADGLPLAVGR